MIAAGRSANRRAFADRAIGFITRVCAAFVEAPTCCACGGKRPRQAGCSTRLAASTASAATAPAKEEPVIEDPDLLGRIVRARQQSLV
jgi:hypothetical protein